MEIHRPCTFTEFKYQFPNQLITWLAPLDPTACGGRTQGIKLLALGSLCFSRKWHWIPYGHRCKGHWPYQGRLSHCRKILPNNVNIISFSIMLNEISLSTKKNHQKTPKNPQPQKNPYKQNPNQLAFISAILEYSVSNKTHFHIFLLID